MKIDRLLSIVVMLLNRERVSARELADRFEVNVRTIYRDVDSINLAGIPVVSYSGNNGGFGILDSYKINKQYLSDRDIESILSALNGINTTLQDVSIDTTIEKIKNLGKKGNYSEELIAGESVSIDILPWGVSDRLKEMLKTIRKACTQRLIISFDYISSNNILSSRFVEPMTLVLKGSSWYLFGFCRERSDYRIFKLTRIKNILLTKEQFVKRDASYRDYFDKFDLIGFNDMVELKLKFDIKSYNLVVEYFDEDSIIGKDSMFIIVKVKYPKDHWIVSWLLGLGDQVEVLEPEFIRKQIFQKANNILKKYQI